MTEERMIERDGGMEEERGRVVAEGGMELVEGGRLEEGVRW
jgi:hypothetical protein